MSRVRRGLFLSAAIPFDPLATRPCRRLPGWVNSTEQRRVNSAERYSAYEFPQQLPLRKIRQHLLEHVRRPLGPPPRLARWAQLPLARKRDQVLQSAVRTSDSREPAREVSAGKEPRKHPPPVRPPRPVIPLEALLPHALDGFPPVAHERPEQAPRSPPRPVGGGGGFHAAFPPANIAPAPRLRTPAPWKHLSSGGNLPRPRP